MSGVGSPRPDLAAAPPVTIDDVLAIDIRVGTVVTAEPFVGAHRPAFKLRIDFGTGVGIRRSSAQITDLYTPDALVGRRLAAVVNLRPRQIGTFMSEVLVLGFPDAEGRVVLFAPDRDVPNGARLF